MSNLLSQNSNALRLLMTEDLYILPEKEQVQIITKAPNSEINKQVVSTSAQPEAEVPVQKSKELIETLKINFNDILLSIWMCFYIPFSMFRRYI